MDSRPSLSLPMLVQGLVALAVVLWTASHLLPPINLDVGALLYVAKRWLSGDRLYVDVIEVNTPWAIALHVPAEFTAAHLGLDGPTWFSIYVVGAIAIAVGLVGLLAREHARELGVLTARTLPWVTLCALGVDSGRNFGQREHLLLIAVSPYLVLSALRAAGALVPAWQGVGIALIAGLGFAIKPHFLLPLVAIELFLLLSRGYRATLRDPVPWTIGAVLVGHAVFALVVTPEYLSTIVPLAASIYASPHDTVSLAVRVLFGPQLAPVCVLLPVFAAVAVARRMPLGRVLALFVAGAALEAALQGKGWDYHALPARSAMLLLSVVVVIPLLERYLQARGVSMAGERPRLVAACAIVPFLLFDGLRLPPFQDQVEFEHGAVHDWVELMEQERRNERALVLSAGMYPQFPAMNYADFKMAMPFLTMWPLHGLYSQCTPGEQGYRPLDRQPAQEAYFFGEVVEGFVEEKPDILVIDKAAGMDDCSGKPFEYLSYFSRDPRFARAFRDYRPLTTIGQYVFYERTSSVLTAVPVNGQQGARKQGASPPRAGTRQ
jgi:hypothetical protein